MTKTNKVNNFKWWKIIEKLKFNIIGEYNEEGNHFDCKHPTFYWKMIAHFLAEENRHLFEDKIWEEIRNNNNVKCIRTTYQIETTLRKKTISWLKRAIGNRLKSLLFSIRWEWVGFERFLRCKTSDIHIY